MTINARTVDTLLTQTEQVFVAAGLDSPRADAELLLCSVLGVERSRLAVLRVLGEPVDSDSIEAYRQLVQRRLDHIPLQHILGVAPFYGLDIQVGPGVFVPRPETERLVETALELIGAREQTSADEAAWVPDEKSTAGVVVDLCSGSGAIAAAMAQHLPRENHQVIAVEKDPGALVYTRQNARRFGFTVVEADATDLETTAEQLVADLSAAGGAQAVVTNPPYIPSERKLAQPEAEQDPAVALYGGSLDGTAIPLAVAAQAARIIQPGGVFVMEHDDTHADLLCSELAASGMWENITINQDYNQHDRFISCMRTKNETTRAVQNPSA